MKTTEIERLTQRIEDALATGEGGQSVIALIRARSALEAEVAAEKQKPLDLQTVMNIAENGVRRLANDARTEGLILDIQPVLQYIRESLETVQNGGRPIIKAPAARRGRQRKQQKSLN